MIINAILVKLIIPSSNFSIFKIHVLCNHRDPTLHFNSVSYFLTLEKTLF